MTVTATVAATAALRCCDTATLRHCDPVQQQPWYRDSGIAMLRHCDPVQQQPWNACPAALVPRPWPRDRSSAPHTCSWGRQKYAFRANSTATSHVHPSMLLRGTPLPIGEDRERLRCLALIYTIIVTHKAVAHLCASASATFAAPAIAFLGTLVLRPSIYRNKCHIYAAKISRVECEATKLCGQMAAGYRGERSIASANTGFRIECV